MAISAVTPELAARLVQIFTQIGLDMKSVQAAANLLQTKQGDLSTLTTDEKSSLVDAINEVQAEVNNIDLSALIDDTTTDTDSTWSSSKIVSAIGTAISDLIGGAPEALNTLNELAAALQDNPDMIANINTILGKVVRVDVEQTFSGAEKAQGRTNIGAASDADLAQLAANVGDIATVAMPVYTNARDGV